MHSDGRAEHPPEYLREQFRGKKIGVLMGGMSSEREISLRTGNAILQALQGRTYQAVAIDVDRSVAETLRRSAIDAGFIALHGLLGEDGAIQGLLEIMEIPYTGSGVLASALAMNKVAAKKIFFYHKLPTPSFQAFVIAEGSAERILPQITIPFPLIIKPSEEGSTIGVSVVEKQDDLLPALHTARRHNREILVEEFIAGTEITVGIINGQALPPIEIAPKNGFYDYHAKYTKGQTAYIIPARISEAQEREARDLAVRAFQVLGCSGAARVDFMIRRDGRPCILEINTVPGMTETSLLPMAGREAGIDFPDLVEKILWGASLHKKCPGLRTGKKSP